VARKGRRKERECREKKEGRKGRVEGRKHPWNKFLVTTLCYV